MNIEQIKAAVADTPYDFLREDPRLGKNIILLTLGGSHAYGMEKEDSDLDIRGITLNSKQEILLGKDFQTITDLPTDTAIYSFNKIIELLTKANPNTVEQLGCRPEQYLYLSEIGKELLANRKMFLSKLCIHSFGNYGQAQLRRLENKSARLTSQAEYERHILNSIENAFFTFRERYLTCPEESIRLYLDDSSRPEMEKEIFMDVHLKHYPLRDYANMWNDMKSIVSSYNKIGKRNKTAMTHNKLGKHMAHTLRLYMMCIDILEKEEIITCRTEEHDLLMKIRPGDFLNENRQPLPEFYEILDEYDKRFEYAKTHTALPELPDYKRIEEFQADINERVIKGEIYK